MAAWTESVTIFDLKDHNKVWSWKKYTLDACFIDTEMENRVKEDHVPC